MKQLLITAVVSAIVACGVSLALRPAVEVGPQSRLAKLERRLEQVARFVGFFLGEDDA